MKANLKTIRKQRKYSEAFKKQLVAEFESGKYSVYELVHLHGLANQTVYNWIYKYSIFNEKGYRIVESNQNSRKQLKRLEARIQELEAVLGRKQIKLEYLEKLIELASEELEVDLKKNYSNRPLLGSESTEET